MISILAAVLFCSFTASAPTEIYTLSLHDALPICGGHAGGPGDGEGGGATGPLPHPPIDVDSGDHRQQRLVGGTSPLRERAPSRGRFLARDVHDCAHLSSVKHGTSFPRSTGTTQHPPTGLP